MSESPGPIVVDSAAAAIYAGVSCATLRSWAHRPATGVNRHQDGYDLAEIDGYLQRRNEKMIRRPVRGADV